MAWEYIVVIDQGTHSTRAVIYNRSGESIFKSQKSIDLFYHDTGHIEQNGQQILNSCQTVLNEAHEYIEENNLQNIAAALTTQRSTVLAWDADTGEAITPALSWLDTRAQDKLKNFPVEESVIKEKTGLPLSPHYGASKLQWLLEHDEKVIQKQQSKQLVFGPLAAYLIFNLIENQPCYVDYSNAHRTLLWNLQTRKWDEELLNAFSIDSSCLPEPVPNQFEYGKIKQFGYPLVLVNGDQNSAVYGYGKLEDQTSFINIGTGAFVLAIRQHRPILNTQLLSSITFSTDKYQEYALEGTVNGAGAALSWAEEEWGINNIEKVPWKHVDNVPIFLNTVGGLGSPFWRSDISPRFLHTDHSHQDYTNEQCMAALMESIVFLVTINIEEMHEHGVKSKQLLIAGGMSKDSHLCQCIADLNSVPVVASSFKEATSRGAAWLVMQQAGWGVPNSKYFYPTGNQSLVSRYNQFRSALKGIAH